jgi:amino acid adenylation domain-containing protein
MGETVPAGQRNHLGTQLKQITNKIDGRVSQQTRMGDADRHKVLVVWNDTTRDYPLTGGVHELFERQAEADGGRTAVVFGEQTLTYAELNRRANCVAAQLLALGVKPNTPVAVCLRRSQEMIVAVMSILKAGGAYAPLDPDYPRARLQMMLDDLAAPAVVTEQALMPRLPLCARAILCVDDPGSPADQHADTNPCVKVSPDDLIYVIYTSGSTGRPKGAAVKHGGFSNLLHWYTTEFDLGPDDKYLLASSFGFDLTQKNIFAPLISGGQLHLPELPHYDPEYLLRAIAGQRITVLNCTPSMFYPVVEVAERTGFAELASLRYLFLGGEMILIPRLRKWMESPSFRTEIVNTYGPTECTDVCASHRLGRPPDLFNGPVLIGRPIANARIYIVDAHMNPLPPGVPGELCIGGDCVGAGYVGNPALTAEKFIPSPFADGEEKRVYKTGDLAKYLPDGTIELLGRVDHQVKVRGFRVELEEIEAVLSEHPGVRQAVVATRSDAPGGAQLVAYVVPSGSPPPTASELRDFLMQRLPDYMVPAVYINLTALPLTPNGKVDRQSLPEPDDAFAERTCIGPETPTEEALVGIWKLVLDRESVSTDDNFFELGGHSLSATILKSHIQAAFGVDLPLLDLFESPTLAHLGTLIEQHLIDRLEHEEIVQTLEGLDAVGKDQEDNVLTYGKEAGDGGESMGTE